MSNVPDPSTWTLRFKLNRTTVILFVTPTQSFTSIKVDLLEAIKAAGLKEINNIPVPSDPEDILFGIAQDRKDPKKGWTGLEIPELDNLTGAKKGVRQGSILNQSPQGAGLISGQAMAFKFRTETSDDMLDDEWDVVLPNPDEYDEEEERIDERIDERIEDRIEDKIEESKEERKVGIRREIRKGVKEVKEVKGEKEDDHEFEENEYEDEDESEDGDYIG